MGRAEDLYRRLIDGGETVIDEFIAEHQSEELFLDFKRSADNGAGPRLHGIESFRLAPGAQVQPVVLKFSFRQPFQSSLRYEITLGHGTAPMRSLNGNISADTLQKGWEESMANPKAPDARERFIDTMLGLREEGAPGLDDYDAATLA